MPCPDNGCLGVLVMSCSLAVLAVLQLVSCVSTLGVLVMSSHASACDPGLGSWSLVGADTRVSW